MGLAIVVASPDLLLVAPRGPTQMRQANAICRLVEIAAEQAARPVELTPIPVGAELMGTRQQDGTRAVEVLTLGL
jgi:hypothetical protein